MLKKLQKNKHTILTILVIGILSLVPVIFLFKQGYFISDDGEWMVIRFASFYQTLRDGQFPPRFFGSLNHGYGYPIGTFLYPAFLYIATPFKLMGLQFSEAVKVVFILSFLFSGLGTFFWLRHRFSVLAAGIGSLLYVYFPYHLYDLYVRGSIGELVAFALLPFLLLAIDKKRLSSGSFLLALLILSHNTFALLLLPFLIFYVYLSGSRRLFLLFPLGALVSAFFWLPSMIELSLTTFSQTAISQWQEYFLTWETIHLVGVIGGFLTLIAGYFLYRKKHTITLFFVVIFFIGIFFATSISSFVWQLGFLPKLVQFPWRFLILTVWASSFLGASLLQITKGNMRILLTFLFCISLLVSWLPYRNAYQAVNRDESYYFTNEDTTTVHNEYMPRTVTKPPLTHPNDKVTILEGRGSIANIVSDSYKTSFHFSGETPSRVTIHTIYYPGWQSTVNGNTKELSPDADGYLTVSLPKGDSVVTTEFRETPMRLLADIVSLLTVILLLFFGLFARTKSVQNLLKWYNKHVWRKQS